MSFFLDRLPGPEAVRRPETVGALVAVVALSLLAFRDSFAGFVDVWTNREFYSHGFLVLLISLYLLWRAGAGRLPEKFRVSPLLALPLAGLSFAWFVARLVHVQSLELLIIPMLLGVLAVALLGFRNARPFLFPLAFLYFAVPVWDVFNAASQSMTVVVVEQLLRVAGIPALIEGNFVTIPEGRFEIAAGCSGLRYSLVMLTLTVLYGYLNFDGLRARVILVIAGMALALFTNWIRVFVIIVAGHLTEMQHNLIANHDNFGWVIFGVALVPFLFAARYIPDPAGDPPANDAAGPSMPGNREGGSQARFMLAVAAVLVASLLGPMLELAVARSTTVAANEQRVLVLPERIGSWRRLPADPGWKPLFPGATLQGAARYRNGDAAIDVRVLVYLSESQGRELVGDDNRVAGTERWRELEFERLVIDAPPYGPTAVERRLVSDGRARREIWSYYEIGGRRAVKARKAKLLQVAGALSGRRDNALVAFSRSCGTSCSAADTPVSSFLTEAAPVVSGLLAALNENQESSE